MSKHLSLTALIVLVVILACSSEDAAERPADTPVLTATVAPTATPEPTVTPELTPTPRPTATRVPISTPIPTAEPESEP